MNVKKILCHCDIDSFYASIAQREDPSLKGKPIGITSADRRSVLATCSYEARAFGVRSAMPSWKAKELCPEIIFVNPDFNLYREASKKFISVLKNYSELVEIVGSDECYIDLSHLGSFEIAFEICQKIRKEVSESIGITCSIGISINKFIAKVASGINKPDALTVITEESVKDFLLNLPIEEFRGVGKKTEEVFKSYNIKKGEDLFKVPLDQLTEILGDSRGLWFYNVVRGKDDREIEVEYERKSLAVHKTFRKDIYTDREAAEELWSIAMEIEQRLKRHKSYGKTLTVKVKYADFQMITRSTTTGDIFRNVLEIYSNSLKCLKRKPLLRPIRFLGICISSLEDETNALW